MVPMLLIFAFDKLAPGLKLISIHERNDDAGCLRYKISRGGHSGWNYADSFYALDNPVVGTTRFLYKLITNPERYRIGIDRAYHPGQISFLSMRSLYLLAMKLFLIIPIRTLGKKITSFIMSRVLTEDRKGYMVIYIVQLYLTILKND